MPRMRPATLFLILATGCSSSSGSDDAGNQSSSSSSSGGAMRDATGSSDATSGASSSGSSGSSGSGSGSGSGSSSSGGSSGASDGSPGDGGSAEGAALADGGAAAGASGVAAFCMAGCNRETACAASQDASFPTATCISSCETGNTTDQLYRADFIAAVTACVATTPCPDAGSISAGCSASARAAVTPDPAVVSLCATIENISCINPAGCLDEYKLLSDPTVQALAACVSSPSTFCANVDAGLGCLDTAITVH